MRKSRKLTILIAIAGALALAGCMGGGNGAGGDDSGSDDGGSGSVDATVRALDNRFDPENLDVSVDDTVEWVNEGNTGHTVEVRPDGGSSKVHSETISPGESTTYTFGSSGTFEVWCEYHGSPGSGMAMSVTVS